MPFHSIPFHSIPLALHSIPLSFHSVTRCKFSIFLASSVRLASAGCAKRKQYAGVPPPAWLDPAFLEVWGRRPYRVGFARPVEGHRSPSKFFILGAKLAPSSHFFAICLHFFRTMLRSCVFYRFPMVRVDFGRFGEGSGGVWKWFFTRFSNN